MQQTSNDANHSHEAKKKKVLYEDEILVFVMEWTLVGWTEILPEKELFFLCVIPHYGLPSIWSLLCENINWKIVIDIPPSQTLFFLQKCWNELTSKSFATLLTLSNVLSQNCTGGKLQFLSYSVITLTGMRGSGLLLTAFDLICHRIIKKSICQWKVNKRKSTQKETTEQSKNFYFQYYSHSAKLK